MLFLKYIMNKNIFSNYKQKTKLLSSVNQKKISKETQEILGMFTNLKKLSKQDIRKSFHEKHLR